MKMFIAISLFTSLAQAAYFKPVCPSLNSEELWKKSQAACMDGIKPAITKKKIQEVTATNVCDCFADQFHNKMTCEETKKFNTDKKFEAEYSKQVYQICMERYSGAIKVKEPKN